MITEDKKLSKEFHRILCNYDSVHDVNFYLQKQQPTNKQKPPKNKKQKRQKRKRKKKSEETQ